jgi:hypothetical protein
MYAICAAHPILLELIARIIFEERYVSERDKICRKHVINNNEGTVVLEA